MEYSLDGSSWESVMPGATTIAKVDVDAFANPTGGANKVILVRTKATATTRPSLETEVVVPPVPAS